MELDIVTFFCEWIGRLLPFECMQMRFMQTAMLGLLLIAPMAAIAGTQVVNFRMAFFSDAIGHSAFAGVAFGLLLAISPNLPMPLLAVVSCRSSSGAGCRPIRSSACFSPLSSPRGLPW